MGFNSLKDEKTKQYLLNSLSKALEDSSDELRAEITILATALYDLGKKTGQREENEYIFGNSELRQNVIDKIKEKIELWKKFQF